MAHPSSNLVVRKLSWITLTCSGVRISSEMSGGNSNVTMGDLHIWDTAAGVQIKADKRKEGYVVSIIINMGRVKVPIRFTKGFSDHPGDE